MYSPSLDHKAAKCGSLLVGHLVPHGLAWHPWLQDRLHLQQRTEHENSELPTLPRWRLSIQQLLLRTIASDWNLNLSCLTKCNGPFLGTRCCYWQQDSMQVPLTTEESLYERRKKLQSPKQDFSRIESISSRQSRNISKQYLFQDTCQYLLFIQVANSSHPPSDVHDSRRRPWSSSMASSHLPAIRSQDRSRAKGRRWRDLLFEAPGPARVNKWGAAGG